MTIGAKYYDNIDIVIVSFHEIWDYAIYHSYDVWIQRHYLIRSLLVH